METDSNLIELIQMIRLTRVNHLCNRKLKIGISIGRLDILIRIRTFSFLFKTRRAPLLIGEEHRNYLPKLFLNLSNPIFIE